MILGRSKWFFLLFLFFAASGVADGSKTVRHTRNSSTQLRLKNTGASGAKETEGPAEARNVSLILTSENQRSPEGNQSNASEPETQHSQADPNLTPQPVVPVSPPTIILPQTLATSSITTSPRLPPADVILDDQPIFSINAKLGQYTPADRAVALSTRLEQSRDINPSCITTRDHEGSTDIVCRESVLVTTTDQDSYFDPAGRTRQALATAHAVAIREALVRVQNEYSAASLSLGALKSLAAALVLLLILIGLHFLFPILYAGIHQRRGTHIRPIRIQKLELLSEKRVTELLVQVAHLLRLALTLVLFYFFIPLVFSFFAPTRSFGHQLVEYVLGPVHRGWIALIHYIPSLLVVLIICFFTFQALKLARFIFREIERGSLVVPGFFPEWAMPTSRIADVLLIAFGIVIAFPYLPGSDSAAFKGVSIFLGVLLSLGSSTAIANVVAGVMLTYTRAFRIGDRVQIADTVGDVIEKTLLATHLRTIKNVDVTVPNGLVLTSHIVNFSRSTPDRPLILNVSLTVGYDIAWREVHKLLIAAAESVDGILADPKPFVLQTSLDDFYVSYQINAYTSSPARMAHLYSDLNQQILDRFCAVGIDITSPHYNVVVAPDKSGIGDARGKQ